MSETGENPAHSGDRGAATSGCLILGAIITVFGGLIILYTVVYFLQRNALETFTDTKPAEIRVFEPTEAQVQAMNQKLKSVRDAANAGKRERFLFTQDDVNTMIAELEILSDCRGTTYVDSISRRGIEVNMTRPTRKLPLSPEQWHLNAKFIFWPELRRRTIAMRVVDILPFKGNIPNGFVESYDAMSPLRLDPENPNIKPYIPKLSRVYVEAPHVVVETGPPADNQPTFTRE